MTKRSINVNAIQLRIGSWSSTSISRGPGDRGWCSKSVSANSIVGSSRKPCFFKAQAHALDVKCQEVRTRQDVPARAGRPDSRVLRRTREDEVQRRALAKTFERGSRHAYIDPGELVVARGIADRCGRLQSKVVERAGEARTHAGEPRVGQA